MGKVDKAEKKEKKEKKVTSEIDDEAAKKAAKKEKKAAKAAAAVEATPEVDEKAAKKAKREAEAAAEEEAPAKKAKTEEGEEKVKLTKEEKAAKKAAKEAKKDGGAAASDFAPPPAAEEKVAAPTPTAGGDENTRCFVGNLPFKMTEEWMKEVLQEAGGTVTDTDWLMHTDTGKWKGAVFATYATAAEAAAAAEKLNGKDLEGRPMKVEVAKPRMAKTFADAEPVEPSASIFLGNLPFNVEEAPTRAFFADCGAITNIKWLEKEGEFKGIAFVDFESIEAATKAVEKNGQDLQGRAVRINFSKPRAPRAEWGSGGGGGGFEKKPQRPCKPTGEKPDGCTELFCGNLAWSIDEAKVTDFFAKAGATVTGTRWLNDKETGEFKGIGFVSFADTGDVDKAVGLGGEQLEGRMIRLDYAGQKKKEGAWQGGGGGW